MLNRIEKRSLNPSLEIKDFLDLYVDAYLKQNKDSTDPDEKIDIDEIIDQFIGFFFAGTDTTGNLVAICLYMMALYPEVQKKVREEMQSLFKNP